MRPPTTRRAPRQEGTALITALLLLVILTLMGLTTARMVTLEERMAASTQDRNLALQAAEAGLADGLAKVLQLNNPPAGDPVSTDGKCKQTPCAFKTGNICVYAKPDPDCGPRWVDPATQWGSFDVPDIDPAPEGFIEYVGTAARLDYPMCARSSSTGSPVDSPPSGGICQVNLYRVTARATRPGAAAVMLQSLVQIPAN